nr:MAG: putative RNA dependent RNA polymerase [Hainan mangrove mitovirus 6]
MFKSKNIKTKNLSSVKKLFNQNSVYIGIKLLPVYIRFVVWILNLKEPSLYHKLGLRIISLYTKSGPEYTVKYLKEATRCVQKFISGEIVRSAELRLGLQSGLPKILPLPLRIYIKSGEADEIRGILTLLTVFRAMKCKPNLKLSTISDPFKGRSESLPFWEVERAKNELVITPPVRPNKFHVSLSAGPNYNPACLGFTMDALAFRGREDLLNSFKEFEYLFGGVDVVNKLTNELNMVSESEKSFKLAKLSFKEEAAGKVRVFAILDSWTQSILSGLHHSLGVILESIPQDGTFDQSKPLYSLMRKGLKDLYSFDLTAATDRLPIVLQQQVISALYGAPIARAWKNILVNRDYHYDSKEYNVSGSLRYSVGQPMGCLSSFNMLGLTHHVIVRIAANRVALPNFQDYALLGDDIVIGNSLVAAAYSDIMSSLGLDINPSKSLVSHKGVAEFAKRLVTLDSEYTPLGPKNIVRALQSWQNIPSVLQDLLGKGWSCSVEHLEDLITNAPFKYLKRRTRLNILLGALRGPFGFISTGVRLTSEDDIQLVNSSNPVWLGQALLHLRLALLEVESELFVKAKRAINTMLDKVQYEWGEMTLPGFGDEMQTQWRYFPSYRIIYDHYDNGYGKLITKRAFIDPATLTNPRLDDQTMKEWSEGRDLIQEVLAQDSPTALVLEDIFASKPTAFDKAIGLRAKRFWRAFREVQKRIRSQERSRGGSTMRGYSQWDPPTEFGMGSPFAILKK